VSDQGPGIAPDLLDQLFKPFSRLGAERGTVEGAGIGLALSRQLMELMGGRIGVDSRPGEGADFWIELPASTLAAPPPPADAEAAASGWQALSESLVLYVEDNPANLALVEQIVARHSGIRLISARRRCPGPGDGACAAAGADPARHPPAGDGRLRTAGPAARRPAHPRHPGGGRDGAGHAQRRPPRHPGRLRVTPEAGRRRSRCAAPRWPRSA
jgi:hypothetical protein